MKDLTQPFLASVCRIAAAGEGPEDSLGRFQTELAAQRPVGLSVELARLALARAAREKEGVGAFARQFFAEATSYYVARDLPSFVGTPGRVADAKEAIDLEKHLRDTVVRALGGLHAPESSPEGWKQYVQQALTTLASSGSKPR